ncbi:MAG TPA: hypothetical protein VGG03_09160 [Thermoanaerobaculia bacterium]|jgi:hypothetical protein
MKRKLALLALALLSTAGALSIGVRSAEAGRCIDRCTTEGGVTCCDRCCERNGVLICSDRPVCS